MNDNEREEIIRSSIAAMKARGAVLTPQQWGIEWSKKEHRFVMQNSKCCCALGCVILAEQEKLKDTNINEWRNLYIENILKVDVQWVREFQSGFDGHKKANNSENGAYELGLLLRSEAKHDKQETSP